MPDFAARRTMMVDTQVRPNDVTKYPIIEAMLTVPREEFVPDARRAVAYSGENLELAPGRVLLEPRTLAKMVNAVDPQPDDLVLEIGCGYGYASAVMACMAQAVIAVESDEDMAREAESRLVAIKADNVAVFQGSLTEGYPDQGPYDVIFIGGAIEVLPEALADQLKEGGRIVALFDDGQLGVVREGVKLAGRINWRYAFNAHAPALPGFQREKGFAL